MPETAPPQGASPLVPKTVSTLSEGYRMADLRKDAVAGLTVAVVAFPLSLAIAVASGVPPERGLYAAIVGGFLVSALGGSRFQIGGPAGAFIVLVASTVAVHGLDGLVLAVMLSGILLAAAGAARLGDLIRHIPHSVSVGFTAGIATVILASQLKDAFGLRLEGAEPGHIVPKLIALVQAAPTVNPAAALMAAGVAAAIFGVRRIRPSWPGMLLAMVAAALAAALLHLPVDTIASRFGGLPRAIPAPALPDLSIEAVLAVLPAALAFTLLGSIESLLSAVVADRMTGRRHRPNMELVAQGIANVGSALFGGICVTGTIARTATNVRAGARSPVSGMFHSVVLLVALVAAAPLVGYVPIPALAGALVVVAWNMVERREARELLRHWRTGVVLAATFWITVLEDLTFGIGAGCALSAAFWAWDRLRRPSQG